MTILVFTRLAAIGIAAAVGLGGCVVSDDPAFNTAVGVGTAASLPYYSLDDGYYYDNRYNRMPHSYHPAYNTHVYLIDSMSDYRRRYPLEARMQRQNRMLSDRFYRQRINNRVLENRLEQQRLHNRQLQHELDRQRLQNLHTQQHMEDSRHRSILLRDRMQQPHPGRQMRENIRQPHAAAPQPRVYRSNEWRWLRR